MNYQEKEINLFGFIPLIKYSKKDTTTFKIKILGIPIFKRNNTKLYILGIFVITITKGIKLIDEKQQDDFPFHYNHLL